jgi:hypothetical protein
MLFRSKFLSASTRCLFSLALVGLASSSALPADKYTETPGTSGNGNFVIGPEYTIDPDLTDRGNPQGKYFEFSMPLADSKIFRGDDATLEPKKAVRKERKILPRTSRLQRWYGGAHSCNARRAESPQAGSQRIRQSDDFQGPRPQVARVHRDRRSKWW